MKVFILPFAVYMEQYSRKVNGVEEFIESSLDEKGFCCFRMFPTVCAVWVAFGCIGWEVNT